MSGLQPFRWRWTRWLANPKSPYPDTDSAVPGCKTRLDMPPGRASQLACRQRLLRHDLHVNMDELKRQAAARALEYVRDGMKLGLGTGSTAKHFVELLGERAPAGLNAIGVPTSEATRADALRRGIPRTPPTEIHPPPSPLPH